LYEIENGLTFIDFFSGIGGFHLGLEQAGHKCVGFCEVDKFAVRSYKSMYLLSDAELELLRLTERNEAINFIDAIEPRERGLWYADDIRAVMPRDLPQADMYTFGFPCQAFSISGKRRGFADTRGTLFFEVMRLAEIRHPHYLFAENVEGLLSHDGGRTFATIISAMAELGYSVEWQVIDSSAYVPQHRERIYIIGRFGNECEKGIFPFQPSDRRIDTCSEPRPQTDISPTIDASVGNLGHWAPYVVESGSVSIEQIGNLFRRESFNNPQDGRIYATSGIAPTLNTSREPKIIINENSKPRIRRLTPKECFRLQGFPDYIFERANLVSSNRQLYRQIGNSVTVPVIQAIGEKIHFSRKE
jgi:DNA (cytosine-5)-methyltransferase 1